MYVPFIYLYMIKQNNQENPKLYSYYNNKYNFSKMFKQVLINKNYCSIIYLVQKLCLGSSAG